MNEIMYSFRDNNVRVVMKGNDPWFIAKDVCEVLDIKNTTQAIQRLEQDEVTMFNIGGLSGETNFVNEYGLYSLILGSRKPEAREFKRWVTHEVLPSIRKRGAYIESSKVEEWLSNPQSMIDVLQALKSEQEEKRKLEEEARLNAPKIFFAEAVGEAENTISINNLAKLISQNGLPIGEIKLFKWLRNNGYLISQPGMDYNTPMQRYIERGLFKVKEGVTVTNSGSKVHKTTRVTGKGQQYFINKFLKEK